MKINKTDNYIEVIGHYDNEIQCAKMTLLADLYAIEHRSGYAKFPLSVEDKLKRVDERLEFLPFGDELYGLGLTTSIYVWVSTDGVNWEINDTTDVGTLSTTEYIAPMNAGIYLYLALSSSASAFTPLTTYKITNIDAKYSGTTPITDIVIDNDYMFHKQSTWERNPYLTLTVEAVQPQPPINYEYKQLATKEDLNSKLDNSKQAIASKGGLVTPSAVLASNELVGVGTNGEQIRVQLGNGLGLSGNASPYVVNVVGVNEVRAGTTMSIWTGTQAQYEAITTKSNTTIYYVVGE